MATNSGDLAQALIEGGLAPQAARIIANAIANASSPTFSQGQDRLDATPVEQLRLITPDIRRYQLTNLDYSPSAPFQERLSNTDTLYTPTGSDHPYKDSQPIVSAPPLSSPRVQGGYYVGVENNVEGDSAVSRVDLKLRSEQGRHLRLDPSTKSLEAVGFTAGSESPSTLAAEFREGEQGTELVVSLRNLEKVDLLLANADSRLALVFPQAAAAGPAGLQAGVSRSLTKKSVRWADGTSQDILTWTDGTATAAPTPPAMVMKGWAIFNGTRNSTNTGSSTNSANVHLIAGSGVSAVYKVATGVYRVDLSGGTVSGSNYIITALPATGTNDMRTVHLRSDLTIDTTQFTLACRSNGDNAAEASRMNVAVFQ
jgi:hypothetical protein